MKSRVAGFLLLEVVAAFLITSEARAGVVFESLYNLAGNSYATLVQSSDGTYLYGTTVQGVSMPLEDTYGTVFAAPTNLEETIISPTSPDGRPASVSNLLALTSADGGSPYAGVIIGPSNNLYGTAAYYGLSNALFRRGMGSVYGVTTNGHFLGVSHRFGSMLNSQGQPLDGANPMAALVLGPSNALYGTTSQGGTNGYGKSASGYGTVFQISSNGMFTELHSFVGSDGSYPTGLMLGNDSNFYGVASYGGSNTSVIDTNGNVGFGTVFKITASGLVTTLYSFGAMTNAAGNALDGAQPNPLIQGRDGNFYGTTAFGGSNTAIVDNAGDVGYGTVFRIDTNGNLASLYSFGAITNSRGIPLDGGTPSGPLAQGPDGNLYGVTAYGGTTNTGTVFVITPAGALMTLHSFGPTNELVSNPLQPPKGGGYYPRGGMLVGVDGNLYGTTYDGGSTVSSQGHGSVFRLGSAAPDIPNPAANLTIVAGSTNSFAITVNSVYAMSYQWQFDGTNLSDGGSIAGSATTNLVITGATLSDAGTYTLTASNVIGTAQTSFDVKVVPAIITREPSSRTIVGGATNVFSVGVTTGLPTSYQWQFDGTNLGDGGNVSGSGTASLTLSGVTLADNGTYSVAISNAAGVIQSEGAVLTVQPFIMTSPPGSLSILAGQTAVFDGAVESIGPVSYQWQFDGTNLSDGGNISGSAASNLMITNASPFDSGTYSVIVSNAAGFGVWTASLSVFAQSAAGVGVSSVHTFTPASDGGHPNGLVLGHDGALYGTTSFGGSNSVIDGGAGNGTFFRFTTNGTLTTIYSFAGGADEADPSSSLVEGSNGVFYGTTSSAINGQYGTVFAATTNGMLTTLTTFYWTNGAVPEGVTLGSDGNLFGAIGPYTGSIYTVNPNNGEFATLLSFGGSLGSDPGPCLMTGSDGNFYGSTTAGGGTLFEFVPPATLTTLCSFTNIDQGSNPEGQLLQTSDGSFYGTTEGGGLYGGGTVFKFTRSGGLTNLYSFGAVTNWDGTAKDGSQPFAGLALGPDGNLYGTAYSGGYSNCGTVFEITTNGVLTTLVWLNNSIGLAPVAPLALGPDGNFYGTTQYGGANDFGTIFQLVLSTSAPQVHSVLSIAGIINLAWTVIAGQTYQIQYCADLGQGEWLNAGIPSVATGASLSLTEPCNQSQRFYRVVWLQTP